MYPKLSIYGLLSQTAITVSALTVSVPSAPPCNASAQLVAAPVGVSLEFFTFPDYINAVSSTKQCLQNLHDLSGTWPPMRIGGTTQDRATYDPGQSTPVSYTVASPSDAPSSLTFGPSFMSLAGQYGGQVILGLNRRLNNQSNTIAAAQNAVSAMSNLRAIELGNEPNYPIAGGSWSASKDFASQVSWQSSVGSALKKSNIFSAGVYFGVSSFDIQGLAPQENASLSTVKDYCSHNYPQSASTANLAKLMSHSAIKSQIAGFGPEYTAAMGQGKPYIFGETNSATQGGGGISPTFGAGLWILDYVMQSLILGVQVGNTINFSVSEANMDQSLYFHQGTIGNCQYCWWGRYDMGAPYYGAYMATAALANATQIAPLDDGTTNYAAYAIYSGQKVSKVLLYNSDYYTSGTRTSQTFTLTGLSGSSVTAKRLTAAAATSRQDQGQNPTFGGQTFQNGTCNIQGQSTLENQPISNGTVSFTLYASQALLVYLS